VFVSIDWPPTEMTASASGRPDSACRRRAISPEPAATTCSSSPVFALKTGAIAFTASAKAV